ncbi:MAG: hypothetical protein EPO51_08000 [Phenylobacterium sp.]|uniref:protein phosphatase 2C domain-containing protein n=1 Tax=Phenylobacterium sp. TaxID=1871053 RepID=UPI00121A9252|nr:protein phosphatase 2C domain-containing protein [Phenylobacterium sp.]TAJ72705.1 MAG: hypothetical protein EPO51_08000 [Phenylobacterium sp.]
MTLTVADAICRPASTVNEDTWGRAGDAVWVLDGATGVAPSPYLDGASDAAWFSREISGRFEEAFSVALSTPAAVLRGVHATAEAARTMCDIGKVPAFELPSASLVVAREVGSRLELTNLGDSVIVWRGAGGPANRFGWSELGGFEDALHRVLDAALADGLPRAVGVERARALARENRKLMNRPDGYWILDLSGAGVSQAQIEACPAPAPVDVLLMTDGFSRLVEVYGAYDWDGLMDRALENGLEPLYDELRGIEAADEACSRFQRFKARDDATAVMLSWR